MIFVLPLIGSLFVYLVFFHYTALKTWKTGLLCLCLGILLYPAAVMHQEYNAEIIYRYLVFLLFAVIALIDLYCMIIPDMLVLITLLLTFPFTAVSPWERAASLAVILAVPGSWRSGGRGALVGEMSNYAVSVPFLSAFLFCHIFVTVLSLAACLHALPYGRDMLRNRPESPLPHGYR